MLHFFINCKKVKEFLSFWINWWENISRIHIKHSNVLNECILRGFPNNKGEIQVLNYCMLHTKILHIYIYKDYIIKTV